MGTHGRHSGEFVNIFNQLQTPNHRIAMVPVAGNENEVVYITGAESFAEIERINSEPLAFDKTITYGKFIAGVLGGWRLDDSPSGRRIS